MAHMEDGVNSHREAEAPHRCGVMVCPWLSTPPHGTPRQLGGLPGC